MNVELGHLLYQKNTDWECFDKATAQKNIYTSGGGQSKFI